MRQLIDPAKIRNPFNIPKHIEQLDIKKIKMNTFPKALAKVFIITCISAVSANLEGPFLFWGPESLKEFKKSALQRLDEDNLIKVYEKQAAIVVFNNQDSVPLSGYNFPRLRKLLERKTILVLPQDFLDVHPDYINNETQVFTLQGPNSERDAEITETFDRLEDIYGAGRVLGVLGNSMSQDYVEREEAGSECCEGDERNCKRRCTMQTLKRLRREKGEEDEDEDDKETTTTVKSPADKMLPEYALYNASGLSGKAMLYSSQWPILRYLYSGDEVILNRPLTATVSVGKVGGKQQFTKLVVTFLNGNHKLSLSFRFTTNNGWWQCAGVEIQDIGKNLSYLLGFENPRIFPSAVIGKSYNCGHGVMFVAANASLVFRDIKMQPYMENTDKFSDSFDCVGYMTEPIWSGVLISLLLVFVVFIAITMMTDIKTNDKYDNNKSKALVITVID